MAALRHERSVLIAEVVLRDTLLDTAEVLRQHGINPHTPYTHTQETVHGAVVHRYIQPPRPEAQKGVVDG